jgi:hypothetical protein
MSMQDSSGKAVYSAIALSGLDTSTANLGPIWPPNHGNGVRH